MAPAPTDAGAAGGSFRSWTMPRPDALLRGTLLLALAAGLGRAGAGLARSGPFGPLAGIPLLATAVLAAWGAAVQLTGGARMDDHAWE